MKIFQNKDVNTGFKLSDYINSLFINKMNWSLFPLLLSTIVLILLLNKSLSFDIFNFKVEKKAIHTIFIYLTICTPILFMLFSDNFKKQLFHKKILLVSILTLFAAINFKVQQAFQFSALFAVSTLIFYYFEKKAFRLNSIFILLIIYFLFQAVSLLWTTNLIEGIKYLGNLTPIVFIPLLFCLFRLTKADFELITLAIFRFSIVFTVLSICSWILESRILDFPLKDSFTLKKYLIGDYNSFDVVFAWSNFKHPSFIALNLSLSLGIAWFYILKKNIENNITYIEFLFFIAITFLLIMLTGSRFMLVSWVIVNVFGLIYIIRKHKKILYTSLTALSICSVISICYYTEKANGFVQDPLRAYHYKVAFQSIEDNTLLGTGLGGMTKYINFQNPIYAPLNLLNISFTHIHPHNQIIGDLMQTGVIGLTIILVLIIVLFFYGFKHRKWLLLLYCIILLILMNIEMPLMYINGIFGIALTISLLSQESKENEKYISN